MPFAILVAASASLPLAILHFFGRQRSFRGQLGPLLGPGLCLAGDGCRGAGPDDRRGAPLRRPDGPARHGLRGDGGDPHRPRSLDARHAHRPERRRRLLRGCGAAGRRRRARPLRSARAAQADLHSPAVAPRGCADPGRRCTWVRGHPLPRVGPCRAGDREHARDPAARGRARLLRRNRGARREDLHAHTPARRPGRRRRARVARRGARSPSSYSTAGSSAGGSAMGWRWWGS